MLAKDNHFFLKSENSLKEGKLESVALEYDGNLEKVKEALKLCQSIHAKAKSEAEVSQKKIQELEHS